ncbi:MAG: hypothetical protein EOO67_18140 [Microbacterium sp.]|nr:MAG: hypothetical protein EOO67_18140 [Microbacterium sp.]
MANESVPIPQRMADDQRSAVLAQAVFAEVARGCRIETQAPFQAVLVAGKPVNHLLHFLVGAATCGFWWLAWAIIAVTGGESRLVLQIDDYGQILRQKVS